MKTRFPWWKFIAGYLFFVVFHQIYSWTGGNLLGTLFGEMFESVYTHMKMLFYAYLCVSLIDLFLRRKSVALQPFLYSRMLLLASMPWMMITMFYAPQAIGFTVEGTAELVWGIVMTGVGLYFCIRMEEPFETMPLRNAAKAMIALAFLAAVITYVGFSFAVPDNFFYVIR
jgi:hypothetical protein